jgi:hypothetical protein
MPIVMAGIADHNEIFDWHISFAVVVSLLIEVGDIPLLSSVFTGLNPDWASNRQAEPGRGSMLTATGVIQYCDRHGCNAVDVSLC